MSVQLAIVGLCSFAALWILLRSVVALTERALGRFQVLFDDPSGGDLSAR